MTWLPIPGYEGRYDISDSGQIRTWVNGNGRGLMLAPLPMTSVLNYAGYHVISLYRADGVRKQHRVHCLVLEAFVGPRPKGFHGAHEDDDKDHNHLGNLSWKSPAGNCADRDANGGTAKGERHGRFTHGRYVGRNNK